ncbi:MAG: phage major capsid protein [Streptococcaceae bacterium]|jgi:hypothetical protein|nr:phage major capsid protein [Streptococcaceae bacterium]
MDFTKLKNYTAAVEKYQKAVQNSDDEKDQAKLYANAMNVLGEELLEQLKAENLKTLQLYKESAEQKMSQEETKFFNAITTDGLGTKEEVVIPLEIIERVFLELTYDHPILGLIKFENAGLRMKAIKSKGLYNGGTAFWGKFTDEIKGQLSQSFDEVDFSQNKLTAFVVVPKDALNYGYSWLKTFIILQMSEAIGVALETALILGNGVNRPVGLIKDANVVDGITTYADKKVSGDLSTLADIADDKQLVKAATKILAPILQKMAVNVEKVPVNIAGKVKLLVSPFDYYTVSAMWMYLNANGAWVESLPFNVEVVQCMAVPQGKGIFAAINRYWAFTGGMSLQEFDQTLALEDLQLYTSKGFYYGEPYDNNTAVLVNVTKASV